MSEKRFVLIEDDLEPLILDNKETMSINEVVDLLNEQQATITNLQGDVNRLNYIIEELRTKSYKQFEKINELQAQLREKEEDERLYANEILELRETNKEHIKFKSLGGNY